MGVRVWLGVVAVGSLFSCGGASPTSQPSATAHEASSSAALPAAPAQRSTVVRIAAEAAPASNADINASEPPVFIYDHGSGASVASFPEPPAAAPGSVAPPPAATPSHAVPAPTGPAPPASGAKPSGNVSNAAYVVAGMRLDFRACYQGGLAEDRDAAGSIRLTIRVGPDGAVTTVEAAQTGRLPQSVVDCVSGRAYRARFEPPAGGSAVIVVPVTFAKA